MPTNKSTTANFMVMGFVLSVGEDSLPTQKTVQCGAFSSIEESFALARELAEGQWRQLADSADPDASGSVELTLRSTEHGYDILQGALVIERFWVIDRNPNDPLVF